MKKVSAFRLQLPFLAAVGVVLVFYIWMVIFLIEKIDEIKTDAQQMSEKTKQKVNLRSK